MLKIFNLNPIENVLSGNQITSAAQMYVISSLIFFWKFFLEKGAS